MLSILFLGAVFNPTLVAAVQEPPEFVFQEKQARYCANKAGIDYDGAADFNELQYLQFESCYLNLTNWKTV